MVAYKPLQASSAFRLWCKARNYNINEYNDVAKALAENLTEEEIFNLYPRWKNEILASKVFRGVIESIAPSPCSYLLSNNSISEEIGVIKVGNEYCCVLDGYNCDCYKYLKNDYLVVTIYKIIDRVYKLIGRPIDDISTLINNCDDKVWDLYANALTTTINQADSDFGKQTVSRYCPKNLAELSAWVASIRPAFASLLNNFLDRKPYTTGVEQLDELLNDSFHYMLYQESIMAFLVWLGVEEKVTYDIIKKISKKKFKEEELIELKKSLLKGWIKNVGTEQGFEETWKVVEDASKYAFNASHSLSVAIDSLYGAYLKSHYPLEYFTVVLSIYADDTTRTSYLIEELKSFNIEIKPIKFRKSYADYAIDKEHNAIYKGISSIKYCTTKIANELSELYNNNYADFIELLHDLENTSLTSKQIEILIQLNYFSEFGGNKYLLKLYKYFNDLSKSKIISKDKCVTLNLSELLVEKYSEKITAKQFRGIDNIGLLKELSETLDKKEILDIRQQLKADIEYLGYTDFKNENLSNNIYGVTSFKTYSCETRPYLVLRQLSTGEEIKTRVRRSKIFTDNPFGLYSILKINSFTEVNKVRKVEDEFVQTDETEIILEEYEVITRLRTNTSIKDKIKRAMKIREEMEKNT